MIVSDPVLIRPSKQLIIVFSTFGSFSVSRFQHSFKSTGKLELCSKYVKRAGVRSHKGSILGFPDAFGMACFELHTG